jgi:multicomponent Na+:H+ antiporter subunit D
MALAVTPAIGALGVVFGVALPLGLVLLGVVSTRLALRTLLPVALAMVALAALVVAAVAQHGPLTLAMGGWAPPLGIALRVDGLAAAFLLVTAVVMSVVLMSARGSFGLAARAPVGSKHAGSRTSGEPTAAQATSATGPAAGRDTPQAPETRSAWTFWPLAFAAWAALNAVFVAGDLFNLYVALELLTLAAVALVAIDGRAHTLAAALRYALFALLGSLLYLLGAALLYAQHGTLDMALLAARITHADPATLAAGALMTAGLAAKTALFPFHGWLPPAHAGAPAPASALLSGLVPKASFYILLRLWIEVLPAAAGSVLPQLLGLLGALAIVVGSILAMRQQRLKLVVAYSTVAQIGYLFLLFPLVAAAGADSGATFSPDGAAAASAWTGGVLHALSHALAKAAMFLCAGLLMHALGHDRVDGFEGIARAMPVTTFAFALAAVTLMGLPPSGGFTAKWLLLTSALDSRQWLWAAVMLAGGLLAAVYLFRPLTRAFAEPCAAADPAALPSRAQQALPLALAGGAIVLGMASALPIEFLQIGRPTLGAGAATP